MIKNYISQQGQTIYDVCLNTYGTLDLLVKLKTDNGFKSLQDDFKPGTVFKYDDTLVVNQPTQSNTHTYATRHKLFIFLLDTYPNAKAAYSLKQLYENYDGFAIRIRRSSDNVEKDFGFDATGNFNLVLYKAFIGTDTAYVVKWYDQTGNGLHWAQTVAANQPYFNGQEIVFYSNYATTGIPGDCRVLEQTDVLGTSRPDGTYIDYFLVYKNDNPIISFLPQVAYDVNGGSGIGGFGVRIGNQANPNTMTASGGSLSKRGDMYVMNVFSTQLATLGNWFETPTTMVAYRLINHVVNGLTVQGNNKFKLGARSDVANNNPNAVSWFGRMKEMIIYDTNQNFRRKNISRDIMERYGLTV